MTIIITVTPVRVQSLCCLKSCTSEHGAGGRQCRHPGESLQDDEQCEEDTRDQG